MPATNEAISAHFNGFKLATNHKVSSLWKTVEQTSHYSINKHELRF